ncbi:hypothetical protein GCM10007972_10630 [Iodidimonas muriae]|uniref:Uncharacterized protein n=1 Tax=Iodidimonas muriae TaxID=261467 RepID=A0ABQ2LBD2_9PROT|nr:hypothetical protein [Iodidimonas muriae]GER07988.1 hypothetical protein JCM17843_22980 [Kordiimonadales bacterium JCM 17843]GGO09261.1 hypothetical protein GCM10007972_10630 [Iodidimonas muriae]
MKTLNKLALSSALVALMAGTAHAQATDTITLDVTNNVGDIQPDVNLVDTAVLAGQSGVLEFTITPANTNGDPWGVNGLSSAGLVELTLDNAVFGNPVSQTAVGDTGDGSCAAGVQPVSAGSTESSITFEIANIENCDGTGLGGELEITVPFALSSIGEANFSVGVEAVVGNTLLADTTAYEINGGPLVEVGPAFVVTVDDSGVPADADERTLALGSDTEKSFTQFKVAGLDADEFSVPLGAIDVAAGNNATNLTGVAVGAPTDFDVTISGVSVAGIDKFTVGGVDVALNDDEDAFEGNVALAIGTHAVVVELAGDVTPEDGVSVSSQTFSADVTVNSPDVDPITGSGSFAEILRDGSESDAFEWVALEPANLNNIFRFTNLEADAQVFVTIRDLNSTATDIEDFDVTAAGLTSGTSAGGELQITAVELGDALVEAGVLDADATAITRGTVEFTVEQAGTTGLQIRRLMFNADGAVNSTAEFGSNPI